MIAPASFQRDWIIRHAGEIGSRNPVMLEKAIVALQLLGHLVERGLPIQFKGGTSLLLRLNPPRRLSIDVDIVKQLFDVAALFDAATDLEVVADVYAAIHARQLVYRQATFTLADTLNDTIEAGFLYSQIGLRGGEETADGLAIAQYCQFKNF